MLGCLVNCSKGNYVLRHHFVGWYNYVKGRYLESLESLLIKYEIPEINKQDTGVKGTHSICTP